MARSLKIVQAARDNPLGTGADTTSVKGYGTFLTEYAEPLHKRLIQHHPGYAYEARRTDGDESVHPFWMKAVMIREALREGFERVVWLDSDTLWLGEPLEPEFSTVFGMTWHDTFSDLQAHFNAGVLYVNNTLEACNVIDSWYAFRDRTHHDQNVLNAHFLEHITRLDHQWNASDWVDHWSSPTPKVIAWHGCPNRIDRMVEYCNLHGLVQRG